jgi:hypothetical protein
MDQRGCDRLTSPFSRVINTCNMQSDIGQSVGRLGYMQTSLPVSPIHRTDMNNRLFRFTNSAGVR